MKKFFVTTPIYYVNDAPHVGSTYTTLAADIISRYYKEKLGRDNVFFLTGTDEHGQKIAESAEKSNQSPIEFADAIVPKFKKAWKLLNIDYDYFIRTTDSRHEKIASGLLQKLYDSGYIYPGTYEGPYCVGCERFYKESELVDNKCPLHPNKEISYQKEKNYFFKLKELVENKVLSKIKSGEYNILPEIRKNEVLSRIEQGVEDISVSREGVSWGIQIPWDKKQTAYVWIEALMNYYSATQFLDGKQKFWPADIHLMAKDILWFHAVIWEAILLAVGLDLPKTIFAHGFFTIDGQKMSKSLGNVITPKQMVDKYGVDGSRYLLISAVSFGSDGDISLKAFDFKYNADLANGLGNLVARIAKLAEKIETFEDYSPKFTEEYITDMESFKLDQVIEIIKVEIKSLDLFINKSEPWNIEDNSNLKKVLQKCVDRIRQIALELKPFLPETARKIEGQFKGQKIKSSGPLFPRL